MKIEQIELKAVKRPTFRTNSSYVINGYVPYGEKNDLPNKLIDAKDYSPTHSSILKLKNKMVVGDGFNGLGRYRFNDKYSNTELLKRIASDYTLFGGFALEIYWNKAGDNIAQIYHIDFSTIRADRKNDETELVENYNISDRWVTGMFEETSFITLPSYKTNSTKAYNRENPVQIYYFKEYNSGNDYYPIPDYYAGLDYIDLENELGNFQLKSVRNNFNFSYHIDIPQQLEDNEKDEVKKNLRTSFEGTDKGNSPFITFGDGSDKRTTITKIENNNSAEMYQTLLESAASKIVSAHSLPSRILAGLEGGGSLGGNGNELKMAFGIFNNTVIRGYQQDIEDVLSELSGKTVKIAKTDIIPTVFSENIIKEVLTTDEIREQLGYKAKGEQTNG